MQYRRIIKFYSERNDLSYSKALYDFYHSRVYELLDKEIGDYHCEGDLYIVEDLENEVNNLKSQNNNHTSI